MKSNRWQAFAVAAVTALMLAFATTPSVAQAPGVAIIFPTDAKAQTGMSYGEWSAVWWQYVVSKTVTDPNSPLLDLTGQGCAVDQPLSSPVFFLVGVNGSGTATRNDCTVPSGKVLFFPLANFIDIHAPGDGLNTPELLRQDLLANVMGPITNFTELHASIDGVVVGYLNPATTPFRACAGGDPTCSAAFSVTLPGQNIFGVTKKSAGFPPGVFSPAVADGFYLMVVPLSSGPHTIKFGAHYFNP